MAWLRIAAAALVLTVLGLIYLCRFIHRLFRRANAFTGNHGLRAQQDLEQQLAAMKKRACRA
jgi:hypothetical protein